MSIKKALLLGFLFAFVVLGVLTMKRSLPEHKEERIYREIKVFMPYKLDKYVGGLAIIDSRSGEKEKPSAQEVMLRLDELEKTWGKTHLRIDGSHVLVLGENNQTITRIYIQTPEERIFLQQFFGI